VPEDAPAGSVEAQRLARVADAILRRADPDGFVPFDRFQAEALYAPGAGYYEAPGRRLGREGDFYTAAHASPLFAATVAQRTLAEHAHLGRPHRFRIVEMGPGDGTLALGVLDVLAEEMPPGADWEYVLVERSRSLRELSLARLGASAHAGRVRASEALSADGPFVGAVIANEFLDAQPSRRLRWTQGGWRELGVRWAGERFVEAEGALRPVIGVPLPAEAVDGAILEFSPGAEGFVRELSDSLSAGAALVVDYGAEEPALLGRHPPGTLQAIRAHRVLDDPLERPGSADLSTFVDFTRVRSTAVAVGLSEELYASQAEALGHWGFEERLRRAVGSAGSPEAEVRLRLSAKSLLFGFDNFRALVWRAGGPTPAR